MKYIRGIEFENKSNGISFVKDLENKLNELKYIYKEINRVEVMINEDDQCDTKFYIYLNKDEERLSEDFFEDTELDIAKINYILSTKNVKKNIMDMTDKYSKYEELVYFSFDQSDLERILLKIFDFASERIDMLVKDDSIILFEGGVSNDYQKFRNELNEIIAFAEILTKKELILKIANIAEAFNLEDDRECLINLVN